jgi:hypothetical protein
MLLCLCFYRWWISVRQCLISLLTIASPLIYSLRLPFGIFILFYIRILSPKSMLLYVYYMSELQYILDINCISVLTTFILDQGTQIHTINDMRFHIHMYIVYSRRIWWYQKIFSVSYQAFVGIENINHAKHNPKWVWDISGLPMANDMLARRLQTDNSYCMIAVYNMFRDNSFKAGLQNVPCNHLFKPLCQIKMTSRWCLYFKNLIQDFFIIFVLFWGNKIQ